ncbi:MAG: phage portal protein [Salinibacterium sp.]|nr:MAG: phage portal protein [Salinibacterium sp.]
MLNKIRDIGRRVVDALVGRNEIGSRRVFIVGRNTSGSRVTEETALTFTAYWRAVNFLATTIANLPVDVLRRDGGHRVRLDNDPSSYILNVQANDELPAFSSREATQAHTLTWGGGYHEIERTRAGEPVALHLVTPDRVCLSRTADRRLVYEVSNPRESNTVLDPVDVFHVRGLAFDGLVGYSPVALFRNAIGMGMSAEQYGASFFGNGAAPGGVLQMPEGKDFEGRPEALARLKESWAELHQGPANAGRVAILEDGMTYGGVGIPNNEAQFLESRKFQVTEMARIFNVPPFVVGDLERSTNNNIEAQAIELVVYGLLPWVRRWEAEVDVKLLDRRNTGRYCKMNLGALLRGDSASRANFYDRMFRMGVYSPNDILELEDRDGIGPDGDVRLVPMNMVKLEDAGTMTAAARAGGVPGGDGTTPNQLLRLGEIARENATRSISATLERVCRKAARAIERHASKPSFTDWVGVFWTDLASELVESLKETVSGLVRASAAAVGGDPVHPNGRAESELGDWASEIARQSTDEAVRAVKEGAVAIVTARWVDIAEERAQSLADAVWAISVGV